MIPEKLIKLGQYWTDSLTLVSGCSPVSEGCAHCWSAAMASRFPWGKGFAKNGKWTGLVEPNHKALEKLEKRAAPTRKLKPRVWQIWNDLFNIDDAAFLTYSYHAMINCTQDIFLILTKRPENIDRIKSTRMKDHVPANIYIGVSVESQKYIGRIDQLIQNWPGKKFVSIEPCLGAVHIRPKQIATLDQVILGGESGPKARPMDSLWARSIRDQCDEADVPYFHKQNGEWSHCYAGRPCNARSALVHAQQGLTRCTKMWRVGKKQAGRLLDGRHWDQLAWNEKGDKG